MIRGLNTGLNIATRAMQSAQWAMMLHTKNISNHNNESYTRQWLENPADPTGKLPHVARLRDIFVDHQFRTVAAASGEAGTILDMWRRVEEIFGDPVEGGFGLAIDRFFDSFKALSENPSDETVRLEVLAAAHDLTQNYALTISHLNQVRDLINEEMTALVADINANLLAVRELNARIALLQHSGESANDLLDQRDKLLDELAAQTGAVPTVLSDGTVRVMIGAVPAVDGLYVNQLELVEGPNGIVPQWVGKDVPKFNGGGKLRGLLYMRDTELSQAIAEVDSFMKDLANAVNKIHRTGFGLEEAGDGSDLDFFLVQDDVVGSVTVNPAVTPRRIRAAGASPALQMDGRIADAIYQLAEGLVPGDRSTSPIVRYRNLVGLIGSKTAQADREETVANNHLRTIKETRSAKWGVSVDEEVAGLTAQQKAFAAAARVIQMIDEMLDVLINMV
ncbi:flagellar hook-associated protein 1 FlgK [Symbiobacterium terraclitae]|uniref:Flagellar hook-associated protein 1 n=1 Tax=Symbiobacterium terraclitae TaxID=557451 RepID=A0ABS4JPW5_9FIRM|nr:flagellar hook-associated protein FlgK [Symbiobacterium terraclitae]MBP2017016.1 flagellar hook-associated protein 1 FlgK [Symbiobacterium terraclitae]